MDNLLSIWNNLCHCILFEKQLFLFAKNNAEVAVKEMLKEIAKKTRERTGETSLYAEDFMDDGSKIVLRVDIDENKARKCVLLNLQLNILFLVYIFL